MNKLKYSLAILPLLALALLGQFAPPPIAVSTPGMMITPESDLWFPDPTTGQYIPFGNANFIYRPIAMVTNVAQLQYVPAYPTTLARYAQTLGYYSPGDGGGGVYQLKAMTTTNMGRFASTNSAYMWELTPRIEALAIKQYGAVGDGVADDSQSFIDWMHDINNTVGILNPGVYAIKPYTTEANSVITIKCNSKFNHFGFHQPTMTGGNVGVLMRHPSTAADTAALISVGNTAWFAAYNVVFSGNASSQMNAANAYLINNSSGYAMDIDSCQFRDSAGGGINLAGSGSSNSRIKNSVFAILNRGIRLDGSHANVIDDCFFTTCKTNAISIVFGAQDNVLTTCYIQHCNANGIYLEGNRNYFDHIIIEGTKLSSLVIDSTTSTTAYNVFDNCTFRQANCQQNNMGASTWTNGQWSTIRVLGVNNSNMRFNQCNYGDTFIRNGNYNFGTWGPKYHFEWLASGPPYDQWVLSSGRYLWNSAWVNDHFPVLTNNVSEIASYHSNNKPYNNFGEAGGINPSGWRIDIIEAGGSTTADLLSTPTATHKILKSGTAIGTPVSTDVTSNPLPPEYAPK